MADSYYIVADDKLEEKKEQDKKLWELAKEGDFGEIKTKETEVTDYDKLDEKTKVE